jgi:23S rRNA (cytidine1920-2'-O)/16S rRNA (cytidine1409-2'-O)-methyltransferase
VSEGVNARNGLELPEKADIVTIDVSFISLRMVFPAALDALSATGDIVVLLKPQFEAGRSEVPRGGVITDAGLHSEVIGRFAAWCIGQGLRLRDMVSSPILGSEGNREFLLWIRRGEEVAG